MVRYANGSVPAKENLGPNGGCQRGCNHLLLTTYQDDLVLFPFLSG